MTGTTIVRVVGRRVWDSRGRPTVEAEIELESGAWGRAIAPAGASIGSAEAVDLRDGGQHLQGLDVRRAVTSVNDEIGKAIGGLDAADQEAIDRRLIELDGTPNKARLGGNALIAVSMAVAHATAAAANEPLWQHLLGDREPILPLPEIQIFGGGAHAHGRLDVQDFMIVPFGADSFDQALEWTAEVYMAAGKRLASSGRLKGVADEGGYWPDFGTNEEAIEELVRAIEAAGLLPGEQVGVALDVAATQLFHDGRYHLGVEGRDLDVHSWCEMLERWVESYPIVSIEDPVAETDEEALRRFTEAVRRRVQVVGDDYLVTNAARVKAAAEVGACNAVLLKPNQAGTLTETRAALDAARSAGWGSVVSARSGETEDVTIAHLAVGWGVEQLKVGSFARSERTAKWNELLRIELGVGCRARFAGAAPLQRISDFRPRPDATRG